jgi:hypothetical protein
MKLATHPQSRERLVLWSLVAILAGLNVLHVVPHLLSRTDRRAPVPTPLLGGDSPVPRDPGPLAIRDRDFGGFMRSHASVQRRLGRCLQRLNAARTELRSATVEAHGLPEHLPADSVRGGGHGGTDVNGTSLLAPVPIRSSGMLQDLLPSLLLSPTCAHTEEHKFALHIIPNSVLTPT